MRRWKIHCSFLASPRSILVRFGSLSICPQCPSNSRRTLAATFSRVTTARTALTELLMHLGEKECRVIATFPQYKASNGLSGEEIAQIARRWFNVDICSTSNRFSMWSIEDYFDERPPNLPQMNNQYTGKPIDQTQTRLF